MLGAVMKSGVSRRSSLTVLCAHAHVGYWRCGALYFLKLKLVLCY